MINKFQRSWKQLHPIRANVYKTSCDPQEPSEDYPLGGSLEPYDIEREKNN